MSQQKNGPKNVNPSVRLHPAEPSKLRRRHYCLWPSLCQLPLGWARSQGGQTEEQRGSPTTLQNWWPIGSVLTPASLCCLTSVLGWTSHSAATPEDGWPPSVLSLSSLQGRLQSWEHGCPGSEVSQPLFKVQSEICICG